VLVYWGGSLTADCHIYIRLYRRSLTGCGRLWSNGGVGSCSITFGCTACDLAMARSSCSAKSFVAAPRHTAAGLKQAALGGPDQRSCTGSAAERAVKAGV
jgi:hypothetical protein